MWTRATARVACTAFVILLTFAAFLLATGQVTARAARVPVTGDFIMAFLACNTATVDCTNPTNHMTYLAQSNDGVAWSPVPGFTPYPGSVPDAIRRGSTVYLYNPGSLVRFHLDTGARDQPTSVSLMFSNGTSAIFVDPAVILDSRGTLHLFFLPGIVGEDPAQCPVGQSTCTKHIMSATEVAGSDGGSFVVDSGTRADYSITGCCFSDPAVFQGPSGYYLYASEGQAVLAFDSPTLTGSYEPIQGLNDAVLVPQGTGGVPAGYYDNSSRTFWTFVTEGQTVQTIARASTSSIGSQISGSSFKTILSGCNVPALGCSYTVASPGFHLNTPGPQSSTPSSSTTTTSSASMIIGTVNFVTIQGARLGLNPPSAANIVGPTVLRLSNGQYRMYFQATDSNGYVNIMSATSADGIDWTYDPGSRVMHGPTSSSIDWQAGEPDVIRGFNGTYFMPYTGRQQIPGAPTGSFFHKIVFASSADSLDWTKDNYNFSDSSQTAGFTSSADVIMVNNHYEMYYTGCCQTISGIFGAQSTDFVHWQPTAVVFKVGHDSSTIEINGTYYMFLMAPPSFTPSTPMNQDVLFLAVSSDGVNWSNDLYRVALTDSSSGNTVDTSTLGDPAAMIAPNGSLLVYVNGPMGQSIFGIKPASSLPKATASSTTTATSSSSSTASTATASTTTSTPTSRSTSSSSVATSSTTTPIPEFPNGSFTFAISLLLVLVMFTVVRRGSHRSVVARGPH